MLVSTTACAYMFESQELEDVTKRNQVIRYQLTQLGRLVIDLNQERGEFWFL